jgi:hypothetical protein
MVVPGDAHQTAQHILSSPGTWRLGIAGDFVMHICDVILVVVLYYLLRPVNRWLALMAVIFNVVQTSTLVANKLNLFLPLFLSGNADYLDAFNSRQLEALSYLSIKMHDHGFGVGLIYFGCACLLVGYLIMKSGYLPRWIGLLMVLAGLCYLVNSFALFLQPSLASSLYPLILIPPFIGETSLCFWLLLKGVNLEKWEKRVGSGFGEVSTAVD